MKCSTIAFFTQYKENIITFKQPALTIESKDDGEFRPMDFRRCPPQWQPHPIATKTTAGHREITEHCLTDVRLSKLIKVYKQ